MKILAAAVCLLRGHHYVPAFEYQYEVRGKETARSRHLRQRYRYECECCGQPTKWMTKVEHDAFVLRYCPSWGGRGTDSQGHRKTP